MILGLDINGTDATVVLLLRARGPLRFNQVQDALGKNPNTIDRALKSLAKNRFVVAETLPGKGKRVLVQYHLTKRGLAAANVIDSLVGSIRRHERELGPEAVEAVEAVYAPSKVG